MQRLSKSVHENLLITSSVLCPLQVVLNPTTNGPKQEVLHRMVVPKSSQDTELKIKLAIRMDKPPNMKHSG